MNTRIRQIGNSKGVIIPANFLSQTGIVDSVDIGINNKSIVITPVRKQLRAGWFDSVDEFDNKLDVDFWQDFVDNDIESKDLSW
jgi:antitoxin MazE